MKDKLKKHLENNGIIYFPNLNYQYKIVDDKVLFRYKEKLNTGWNYSEYTKEDLFELHYMNIIFEF